MEMLTKNLVVRYGWDLGQDKRWGILLFKNILLSHMRDYDEVQSCQEIIVLFFTWKY